MTGHELDRAIREMVAAGLPNGKIGERIGKGREYVRNRRIELGLPPSKHRGGFEAEAPRGEDAPVEFTIAGDTGEFKNYVSDKQLTDFSDVFRKFNRDPDEFVIVGDVRMRAWEQSKRLENGDRDTVTLYSYGATFRRKGEHDDLDLPALYAAAHKAVHPRPVAGENRTTVVVWSDPQIGKVASRGGTEELIARSVEKRRLVADELAHRRPKATFLLDGGDGIEGFESGGNPMFTNDLSLPKQLDLYGTELMEWIRVLMPYGNTTVVGIPSNHAAWRNGKQNLGIPGDDLGLFMHRQVKKVADAAGLSVKFVQSDEYDESVAVDIDGTVIGLVHGNQFGPGQAIQWWEKQTFGSQAVARADVLVTAHYHSFGAGVAGRNPHSNRQRWWLGAPTLDNGSDWYRNAAGRDSDPGVMIFDVTPDGFDLSSLAIL